MTERDHLDLPDLPCNVFVELVTDYLEGALPTDERARVDQHLGICAGCRTVLAQWHEVIRLSGRLASADVDRTDPDTRTRLMASFREVHGMSTDAFLDAAVAEARAGRDEGGIPIGSVLVVDGEIVGRGHNRRVQDGSVVLHAEMDCLESAGRRRAADYRRATLYSTLSPCDMCSGAILLYGIPRVVIGEHHTFRGPEEHLAARGVRVEVVGDARCIELMEEFIAANPGLWNEDIGE